MRIAQVGSSIRTLDCDRGTENNLGIIYRVKPERLDLCEERQEEEEERGKFEVVLHCKRDHGLDRSLIGQKGGVREG